MAQTVFVSPKKQHGRQAQQQAQEQAQQQAQEQAQQQAQEAPRRNATQVFVAGALATFLSRLCLHPLDTCKTYLQNKETAIQIRQFQSHIWATSNTASASTSASNAKTIKLPQLFTPFLTPVIAIIWIIRQTGFSSLYRGFPIACIGQIPAQSLYMTVYESVRSSLTNRCNPPVKTNTSTAPTATKDTDAVATGTPSSATTTQKPTKVIPPKSKLGIVAFAAAISNTMAAFIRVPSDVIKLKVQAGTYRSSSNAFVDIVRKEGIRGLFRGLGSQIARDIPYAVLLFVSYEALMSLVQTRTQTQTQTQNHPKRNSTAREGTGPRSTSRSSPNFATHSPSTSRQSPSTFFVGATAGAIATFLTTPLDVCKTRVMIQDRQMVAGRGSSSSLAKVFVELYREEGLVGFWKGSTPRVSQKILSSAFFFLFYQHILEAVKHTMDRVNNVDATAPARH